MKKVGIVLPAIPTYSETFFRSKIRSLINHGFDVTLFVSEKSQEADLEYRVVFQNDTLGSRGVLPIRLAIVLLRSMLLFPSVTKRFLSLEKQDGRSLKKRVENLFINYHILSQKKLDFLHFGFATATTRRENVAKAIEAKCSLSMRGYDINIHPLLNPGCYNQLWKHLDKVHTISDDLRRKAIELGMPPAIEVQKITPAIDAQAIKTRSSDTITQGEPLRILTIARLHWIKGLDYAFRAIKILKDQGLQVRYDIIGTGGELERLTFALHQHSLESEVNFLGRKSKAEIENILCEYQVYIQPSLEEGFCNAVLEAQAAGLYCIVSETGGLVENVSNGESGWTVPTRDPEALADKIKEVISLPKDNLSQVSRTARNRVLKEFNLEKQQKEFAEFFV